MEPVEVHAERVLTARLVALEDAARAVLREAAAVAPADDMPDSVQVYPREDGCDFEFTTADGRAVGGFGL